MLASNASYEVEHAASVLLPERFIRTCLRFSRKIRFVPFGTRFNGLLQSVLHLRFKKNSLFDAR